MSRSGFKKIVAFAHLWLGLISGLVVFMLGITGAIYAFSDELKELFYADRLHVVVPANAQKLPLDALVTIAQNVLGQEHKLSRAEISNAAGRTYMFRALKVNKGAFGYWNYYTYYYKVYLNPYTGALVKLENTKYEFFTIVLAAHMNLLLGDGIGNQIVRYAVICFLLLLLSGIVLWWPKNQRMAKNGLTIKIKAKFKRLNYDLHKVLGFYASLLLLISALTGLAWSLNLGSEKKATMKSDTTAVMISMPHQAIFANTNRLHPHASHMLYNFPAQKSGTVNVTAYKSDQHLYEKVQFRYDRYTGRLVEKGLTFDQLNPTAKLIALNYDLHTGTALGFTGKILAFIASLIASSLPITGLIFYLYKKR